MSDEKTQQIESYFLGKGVSLEQFFLDLHNGNIIKGFGKWLLDIIAIFLLLISISGVWIWLRKNATKLYSIYISFHLVFHV